MPNQRRLTAIIEREDEAFVALCPELDVASEGKTIEEARANLVEALSLFFETADPSEVVRRFQTKSSSSKSRSRLGRLRVLSGSEICHILERHGFIARPSTLLAGGSGFGSSGKRQSSDYAGTD
jgi:predicted RNase H-like HicB family nuclease